MSMKISASIANNIIAIAIHICLCFVLFYLPIFIYLSLEGVFLWLSVAFCIIVVFGSYFLAGGFFLRNTKNARTDIFSVIMLVIMLFVASFFYWFLPFGALVFYTFGLIISSIAQIPFDVPETVYIFIALSPLQSLAMWAGLRAKKYAGVVLLQQQQSTLKNMLLIITEKKEYLILFIALFYSVYFSLGIIFAIMFIADGIGFYIEMFQYY